MSIALSFVLLESWAEIAPEAIRADLAANWKDIPSVGPVEEHESAFTIDLGDSSVVAARMSVPIPWSSLEGACETSWLWPDAKEKLRKHADHMIVTMQGELEPVPMAVRLTQVTAAILGSCRGAIGVSWGGHGLLAPAALFRDMALQILPEPTVPIWVDFRVGPAENGKSAGFTTGLAALGLMEFETLDSPEKPGELRSRLLDLASYLIANGPVIKDGDTVGGDENEKIRVVYSESAFGHEGKVMRLEHEAPKKRKRWFGF